MRLFRNRVLRDQRGEIQKPLRRVRNSFIRKHGMKISIGILGGAMALSLGAAHLRERGIIEPIRLSRVVEECPTPNSPPETCKHFICEREPGSKKREECKETSWQEVKERREESESVSNILIAIAATVTAMGATCAAWLSRRARKRRENQG